MLNYSTTTALITGASSGIGQVFAESLAKRGANLVLVARGAAKLDAIAMRLQREYPIKASVIVADLADAAGPARVFAEAQSRGLSINLLVNNAGFAVAGGFLEHEYGRERDQIAVNVSALTELSHLFGRQMSAFGRNAGIINIASSAAFQPLPFSAVYAATKSYVLLFSEALGRELRGQGTHVIAVCPGPVKTAFWEKVGSDLSSNAMDTPEEIVEESLAAFDKGRAVVIPGRFAHRLLAFTTRLVPRALMAQIAERTSRKIMMAGHV
jgi:uncharacterized protein